MKYPLGLVIGKFYPPHRGHKLLIDTGLAHSKKLAVIVCGKPNDEIPGEVRGRWLQEIHPAAHVIVIDDRYDENDSRVWAENTIHWLGRAPDAVFTSEHYGDRYAELMGSRHICVDQPRAQVPVSGTEVRKGPYANWEFIEPPVRGWFAKRVCILGAESTGTTTLAKALAEALDTSWVQEYGREYSQLKLNRNDLAWRSDEFTAIALEQSAREEAAARQSNRILICDTNSWTTQIWHRRYMASHSRAVEEIAQGGKCDLYLLTGDEIPFVQDGLRDGESIRHEMHCWFEDGLRKQNVPWDIIRGTHQERMRKSLRLIQSLFMGSTWQPVVNSLERQYCTST